MVAAAATPRGAREREGQLVMFASISPRLKFENLQRRKWFHETGDVKTDKKRHTSSNFGRHARAVPPPSSLLVTMVEIGSRVDGKNMPVDLVKTYPDMHWFVVFCFALCNMSPFFAIFFGVKDPNPCPPGFNHSDASIGTSNPECLNWPYAWWAFCFVGTWVWPFFAMQTKVTRERDNITMHSVFGHIWHVKIHWIDNIEVRRGCCGPFLAIHLTERT